MVDQTERWWKGDTRERFWLESTGREDIGADLKAPMSNASGRADWRYDLFREARIGDVVFHYDTRVRAITSCSRVAGPSQARPIVWAAHGSYARDRGAEPEELPGYFIPLAEHQTTETPVTLDMLRAAKSDLRYLVQRLEAAHRKPLYFPFELSERPVRPNQGYAFKLPADFVETFPALAKLVAAAAIDAAEPSSASLIRRLAGEVNAAAGGYQLGRLQALRKELRRLARPRGRRIFSDRSTSDTWAFHSGGRDELQFNIGLDEFDDGSGAVRAGVAFSLEPSQSLPDWTVLLPHIARFNDILRERPETFGDLAMWCWQGDHRSADLPVGPVPDALVQRGAFVFLGARVAPGSADADWVLRTFDQLLPLYLEVQTAVGTQPPLSEPLPRSPESLQLDGGVRSKISGWTTATLTARTLNISLRHNELQNRLLQRTETEHGMTARLEARIGARAVDMVAQSDSELWYFEVKTASSVRQCIREAIGQLLEYAFWPGATTPTKMVVVGEAECTPEAAAYLEVLNASLPVRIEYQQLILD
jgi:hypothetical protein